MHFEQYNKKYRIIMLYPDFLKILSKDFATSAVLVESEKLLVIYILSETKKMHIDFI